MKRVIINGDDFGMNERCSAAIARAFRLGLITDTTMMANGGFFEQAVALAAEEGFSDRIGIHFNLTEGKPLTREITGFSAFVDNGCFHKAFLMDARPLSDAEKEAVLLELNAQAARLERAGIRITHADSHHYTHNDVRIAPLAAQVCRERGIGRIRLHRTFDTLSHPSSARNRVDNGWWREQGFVTPAQFGRLSDIEEAEIPDLTEIMVHPDFDKAGNLIDRIGMSDGYPTGQPLYQAAERIGAVLCAYTDLHG